MKAAKRQYLNFDRPHGHFNQTEILDRPHGQFNQTDILDRPRGQFNQIDIKGQSQRQRAI